MLKKGNATKTKIAFKGGTTRHSETGERLLTKKAYREKGKQPGLKGLVKLKNSLLGKGQEG